MINNALHTYSAAYRDRYDRNGPLGSGGNGAEYETSEIVRQKNGIDCLCRVNEIHSHFLWPRIIWKGCVI